MRNIRASLSLLRAFYVLMREGVITALPDEGAPAPVLLVKSVARLVQRRRPDDVKQSKIIGDALARLGPSWVKLGQFLATRPDIVGDTIARDLELLQDRMEPFTEQQARETVEASLNGSVSDLYVEFGAPVAAASIAQVHRAVIKKDDGSLQDVAVKIIRPGVRERFSWDLETFYFAAKIADRMSPALHRLELKKSVDVLAQSAQLEMDLRLEAAAFSEMAGNIIEDEGFRLPEIDWPRTGRDCLTMEWVGGIKMNDMAALQACGIDLPAVANSLNQNFLRHAIRDGFFHADMHPGNLFLDANGDVVAVDMGICGRLNKAERRFLAEILFGFIQRDYRRVAEVHIEAGYVPADKDVASFAQALRAVGEPIYGKTADQISMAGLLGLLFEITDLFDMKTQPQLLLLQKTMVVVEGVARKLDPNFNMWESGRPVVEPIVERYMGPQGKLDDLRDGLSAAGHLVQMAPVLAKRTEELSREIDAMAKNGVRLDKPTIDAIGKAEARHSRSGRLALWVIAIGVAVFVFNHVSS